MSIKRTGSAEEGRSLLSQLTALFPACFQTSSMSLQGAVFIDSGADTEFMDEAFANKNDIKLIPSADTRNMLALDGHSMNNSHLRTEEITLTVGGNHQEKVTFMIINSPELPVALGTS
ncbi:hypothetical protein GOODEAATRI_029938 [Goodea atripinnis]|uniref:Peptidase A2 domain-containing protein n=1 Tax=Goodea atripinnis TaxID=208336 RepID=A0ABV0P8Y0_9TELE